MKVENKDGKGNPYHDNESGEFTSADGTGGGTVDDEKDREQSQSGVRIPKNASPQLAKLFKKRSAPSEYDEIVKKAVSDPYSESRQDNALWFKTFSASDAYFDEKAKGVFATATQEEISALYSYTVGSGKFNRPLAGFDNDWDPRYYFKGVGNVPLNQEGAENKIKALTNVISRSKMVDDVWVQSGQYPQMLEGIFKLPWGSVSTMSNDELQTLVGMEGVCSSFISTSIKKDGGFDSRDMIFNIYMPKGSELLYVSNYSAFNKDENEAIAQRGGTYKITKIERKGYKIYVDLEHRAEKGYDLFGQN